MSIFCSLIREECNTFHSQSTVKTLESASQLPYRHMWRLLSNYPSKKIHLRLRLQWSLMKRVIIPHKKRLLMDQLTHTVRRSNWINIIRQCQDRPAGTTAKQWLAENDISEKSYYYWLRKIRREVCEQEGLQDVTNPSALSFVEIPVKTALDTTPVPTVPAAMTPVAVIRSGRLTLELSNDISESLLCRLLQEVLHA